jgi:hypothetical protein
VELGLLKALLGDITKQRQALDSIFMEKQEIDAYKAQTGVASVSKAMRPNSNPTGQRKRITGIRSRNGYYQACTRFFEQARDFATCSIRTSSN